MWPKKSKVCNVKHPKYPTVKCQRETEHDGLHIAKKPRGLTHFLYYAWKTNGKHATPILRKRSDANRSNGT